MAKIDDLNTQKDEILTIEEELSHPGKEGRIARLKAVMYTAGNKETNDELVGVCLEYIQELNARKPHEDTRTMLKYQIEQAFLIAVSGNSQVYEKLIQEKLVEKYGTKSEGRKASSKRIFKNLFKRRKKTEYLDYDYE